MGQLGGLKNEAGNHYSSDRYIQTSTDLSTLWSGLKAVYWFRIEEFGSRQEWGARELVCFVREHLVVSEH
jgi:hypothetical protein